MRTLILVLCLSFPPAAFASDPLPKDVADALQSSTEISPLRPQKVTAGTDSDLLVQLANEVDDLSKKLVVQRASDRATQTPRKVRMRGARTVFNYSDDGIYEVMTAPDHVTDIALAPGEQLTSPPTAGDTVRWNLSVMKSGDGPSAVTHLVVKPLEEDVETNLIVATDKHTYQLKLRSTDIHMPSIAWNYPVQASLDPSLLKKEPDEPLKVEPETLSFAFEIDGDDVPWRPLRVFTDGQKTYIQMPKQMKVKEAPVLLGLSEDSDPVLMNYRVSGDYYIVDRLIERAELRVGTDKAIQIQHESVKRSWLDRLF